MTPSQIRTYSRNYGYQNDSSTDVIGLIQSIPTLTKLGAVFLVLGKFMGIMAIPAAFIPELNLLVVPLLIAWGGFVFISIVLCSVDHFQKKKLESKRESIAPVPVTTTLKNTSQLHEDSETEHTPFIIPLSIS
ncbi:MAG: hypothetical protein J7M09_05660 [Deltaproteobacteria bacterium]|nr:hypothetical protein [Candidatus Tharpella sp.]